MKSNNENYEIKPATCIFCGETYTEDQLTNLEVLTFKPLTPKSSLSSKEVILCEKCVDMCHKAKQKISRKVVSTCDIDVNISPKEMKSHLDEYVIGQEKAKKILSVAAYNHLKRIKDIRNNEECVIEKSNVLMLGPTGSGKTYLLEVLAKKIGLPMVIEDVTNITSAGYVGRDVDDLLRNLIDAADGDIKKAENGIIFLDEGDKLRKPGELNSGKKDVNGEGVQQALLKMIQGGKTQVKLSEKGKTVEMDTKNILFILGGAFAGIDKIIDKRIKEKNKEHKSLGVLGNVAKDKERSMTELLLNTTTADLEKFGMTPELLGRFPITCPLIELTEEEMGRILTEPKNALIKQYERLFELDDVSLEFEPSVIEGIAKEAKKTTRGARALRSVMEDILVDAMFEVPGSGIESVKINEKLTTEYITEEETKKEECEEVVSN